MFQIRGTLVAALLVLGATTALASRSIPVPSIDDETTQTHQDDNHIAMAMWLSTEMFRDSVSATMAPADVKVMMDGLKGYAIYGLLDTNIDGATAAVVAADRAKLRASAQLKLGDRAPRSIVRESELPAAVLQAVHVMKPIMAGALGKVGDAMEFVVFKDADEHGNSLADPRAHLVATLTFDKETFVWRMPLVSLQPPKVDPATGDTFPGDFDFNPFTGHKLDMKK